MEEKKQLIPWNTYIFDYIKILEYFSPIERVPGNEIIPHMYSMHILVLKEVFREALDRSEAYQNTGSPYIINPLDIKTIFKGTSFPIQLTNGTKDDLDHLFSIKNDEKGRILVKDCDQAIFIIDHLSRCSDTQVFNKKNITGFRNLEKMVSENGYKIKDHRQFGLHWFSFLNILRSSLQYYQFNFFKNFDLISTLTTFHCVMVDDQNREEEKLSDFYTLYPFIDLEEDIEADNTSRERIKPSSSKNKTTTTTTTTTTTVQQPVTRKRKNIVQPLQPIQPQQSKKPSTQPIQPIQPKKTKTQPIQPIQPIQPPQSKYPHKITRKSGSLKKVRIDQISSQSYDNEMGDVENQEIIPVEEVSSNPNKIRNCLSEVMNSKGEIKTNLVKAIFDSLQSKNYTIDLLDSIFSQNKSERVVTLPSRLFELANSINFEEINFGKIPEDLFSMFESISFEKNTNIIIPTQEENSFAFLWIPIINGVTSTSIFLTPNNSPVNLIKVKSVIKFIQLCIVMKELLDFMTIRSINYETFKSIISELLGMSERVLNLEQDVKKLKDLLLKKSKKSTIDDESELLSRVSNHREFATFLYEFINKNKHLSLSKSDNYLKFVDSITSTLCVEYDSNSIEHKIGFINHCRSEISRFQPTGDIIKMNSLFSSFTPSNINTVSQQSEEDLKRKYSLMSSDLSGLLKDKSRFNPSNFDRYVLISFNNNVSGHCKVFSFGDVSNGFSITNLRNVYVQDSNLYNRYEEYMGKTRVITAFFFAPCLIQLTNFIFQTDKITNDKNISRQIKSIKIYNRSYINIEVKVGGNTIDSVKSGFSKVVQINSSEFSFTISCLNISFSSVLISKNKLNNLSSLVADYYVKSTELLRKADKLEQLLKKYIENFQKLNTITETEEDIIEAFDFESSAGDDIRNEDEDDEDEDEDDDDDEDEDEDEY
uniref:Rep protein n=1 Tax=Dictyostelium discoideum TaxID=44689 RepID=O15924_DICDI|nr:Rep protein [Dictyostelium discoideum]